MRHAPERLRTAILRDWHICILAPQVLEDPGEMFPTNLQKYVQIF